MKALALILSESPQTNFDKFPSPMCSFHSSTSVRIYHKSTSVDETINWKFSIFHTIKLKPTYATQIAICRTTISKAKPMEKAFHWLVRMMLWWSATGWGSKEFWWRMELILAPIKSFNQTRTMYQHTVFHRKNVAIVSSRAIWDWTKEVCRPINMTQLISSADWKK